MDAVGVGLLFGISGNGVINAFIAVLLYVFAGLFVTHITLELMPNFPSFFLL